MDMEKDAEGLTPNQHKYVEGRLGGLSLTESQRKAGYKIMKTRKEMEPVGGVVWRAIRKAINKEGMSDSWIAKELREGVERSKDGITRFNPKTGEAVHDPDLSAHERYLNRICKLKGYERELPAAQVAVQINNQVSGLEGLAHGEAESLIDALRAEIVSRESTDVLEAHLTDEAPAARLDMDKSDGEQSQASGD